MSIRLMRQRQKLNPSVSTRDSILVAVKLASFALGAHFGFVSVAADTITNFQQFYVLSTNQAGGDAVQIRGVVLCYDRAWNQLYIHDGDASCWFSPSSIESIPESLQMGDAVEIRGATTVVGGAAAWTNLQLTVLGRTALPPARKLAFSQLAKDFGQWVETEAEVRVAESSHGRLSLLLHDAACDGSAWVFGPPDQTMGRNLIGCKVRVRGINASKIRNGELNFAVLNIPNLSCVEPLMVPRAFPLLEPTIPIDTLFTRELGSWTNGRVHVNGLIATYVPGEYVVVKDPTGMILARTTQVSKAHVDDRIDLWGYLSVLPHETILRDAYFEPVHTASAEQAEALMVKASSGSSNALALITQLADLRLLKPEAAAEQHAVCCQGVITYIDPEWSSGFIQDSGGAAFFELRQNSIKPGQWVQVTGVTTPGGFTPQISNASVRAFYPTNLPMPIKEDLADLMTGTVDAYWIEVEGVVRSVKYEWGHLYLGIVNRTGSFKALVPGISENAWPTNLVDARVNVRGVCAYELNDRHQLTGVRVQAPDLSQIRVLEPAPADPFSSPTVAVRALGTFNPDLLTGRRVKVGGTVTLVLPDRSFCLQDVSGGIRVRTQQTNDVRAGDTVEVVGFPAPGDFAPGLDQAIFKVVGPAWEPMPKDTTAERILTSEDDDGMAIRLVARLLQRIPRSAHPKLVLQGGSIIFTASLSDTTAGDDIFSWPAGSLLRLSGVCLIQGNETHAPVAFRLQVTHLNDISLLQKPPVWTARRTLLVVGIPALVFLAVSAWVVSLRRQVRSQTELIRKEKNLLATLIDHLPDNVFVKDVQGRYVLTNRAHTRFHGRTSEKSLLGKSTFDVCPPDLAGKYAQADRQILSGESDVFSAEEPARDNSGNIRCLLTTKVPLRDSTGRIVGLLGISRDVTERGKAEHALKTSESFTRSLVESLPQNILRKDPGGRFTFVNEVFCRTVGKPMYEILGRTDFDLYPAELAAKFRKDDVEVIAKGTPQTFVEETRNTSGEKIFVEVIKTPLFDADGRSIGLQIIFWDVTPRKQAEAQLAYERDLLNALLENYPDAIYFKDLQSRFVRISRSKLERSFAVALSRYHLSVIGDAEEKLPAHLGSVEAFACYIIGKTDFDIFEKERAQSAYDDEREIIRTGKPLVGKVEKAVLPDRRVYWSLSTKMPWHDPEGRMVGTFGISKDITSIKEAEAKLDSVHKQLVEASRQAGMAEVATRVLHNVGNVLNSVNVSATLLAEKVQHSKVASLAKLAALLREHSSDVTGFLTGDPRGRQIPSYLQQLADRVGQEQAFLLAELAALIKNVDHIKNIVAMQQSHAKGAGVTEIVQPAELVEDAVRINAASLSEQRVQICCEFSSHPLPEIATDKHAVLQILVNLIRNAGHACEESDHPDKRITLRTTNGGNKIRISVIDNGVGIPSENLARIFNLGFTTRKGGHGFGLHSGALAAKELGGALSVHSEGVGLGATFTLELPLPKTRYYVSTEPLD